MPIVDTALITSNGISLNYLFKSGNTHHESKIGCYARDEESYRVFDKVLDGVIKQYHSADLTYDQLHDWEINDLDFSSLDAEYIVSTRIRVARNIKGMPFPSAINAKDCEKVESDIF